MIISVLMIGDIVGKPGREIFKEKLPSLVKRHKPDLIIVNGENASNGRGLSESSANEIFSAGADVITMGNHTWDNKEITEFIDDTPRLLRPANYPPGTPGRGWIIHEIRPDIRPVAVVSLMGRSYMNTTIIDCPFQVIDKVIGEINSGLPDYRRPALIVDFHAESTSEKETMGFYLAGRAAAVLGTHTHVQTSDERVLPGGVAYITDAGMSGVRDSVLGVRPDIMIQRFLTQMPARHVLAEGPRILSGAVVRVDGDNGKALDITRFNEYSGV